MNREVFFTMVKDVHEHPEHLANYRKKYKNVYPFSDGIFKMLMANEAKPERTVKYLNTMLGLYGDNAIRSFMLGVPENPGVLDDKTAIFDIYVLSILTENQFPTELNTYLHHSQIIRNCHFFYEKLDIYLVELEKFFAIEDLTPVEKREKSNRADMLRIFRDVLEEKEIPEEKLKRLLDKDFAKDVSLVGYTDETLLNEVDGMTNILYEKQ